MTKYEIIIKALDEITSTHLLNMPTLRSLRALDKNAYNQRIGTVSTHHFVLGSNTTNEFIVVSIKKILMDQHHKVESLTIFGKKIASSSPSLKMAKIFFKQQSSPSYICWISHEN